MTTKMRTYATYTKLLAPTRKGGHWSIREMPVGADSSEDAEAFAAAIVASLKGLPDRLPAEYAVPPCDPGKCRPFGANDRTVHTAGCDMLASAAPAQELAGGRTSRAAIEALAERFRAMRGIPLTTIEPKPEKIKPKRVARTAKAAPPPPAPVIPKGDRVCPRCLRVDFRTDKGRTWHVENNPECTRYVKPGEHAYATEGAA